MSEVFFIKRKTRVWIEKLKKQERARGKKVYKMNTQQLLKWWSCVAGFKCKYRENKQQIVVTL